MKKFTANYAYTNANFVIQNLGGKPVESPYLAVFCILKNILQRGALVKQVGDYDGSPTMLSRYLRGELGDIHREENFKKSFFLIAPCPLVWNHTIKGDVAGDYFPAREFYDALPDLLGEYGFVQQLILPEVNVGNIVPEVAEVLKHESVDFYCPIAKLIIEIDGPQHEEPTQKILDERRDTIFKEKGIETVRIRTRDWRTRSEIFEEQLEVIRNRLGLKFQKTGYQKQYERLLANDLAESTINQKLLPTAVLRFQLLVVELLLTGQLTLDSPEWSFTVLEKDGLIGSSKDYQKFARLALIDLFTWLKALCNLQALPFKSPGKPEKMVRFIKNSTEFRADSINVDFSLLRRYTDEADHHPEVIFVRTDYFHANHEVDAKDYFTVSTSEPVNYRLKKNEKTEKNLEFFLRNLFDKRDFREGQLDIIINALNRKDTIGLLPTGGGKSLCYQLPCLLQPAISFVVCPIKSLMLDQKANLDNAFITRTHYIIGNLKGDEKEEIQRNFAQGRYFFIWISPERFQSVNFRRYLGDLQQTRPIAYAVIDEVHCMSEWGQISVLPT